MLPPFIIEQIRKREEEEARAPQPTIQLPIPHGPRPPRESHHEDADRGVVIIDLA